MLNKEYTLTLSDNLTKDELKEKYINSITKLSRLCEDISLLDLINKLLEKSV